MLPAPPRFAGRDDIAAFSSVPLAERLRGRDLIAMIREAADDDANAVALSFLPAGKADGIARHVTRREMLRGAATFAAHLADHGIGHNDVVASLLPNGPGTVAAAIGTMAAAVLAPVNYFLEVGQIEKLIAESSAKVILVPRDPPAALAYMFDTLRALLAGRGATDRGRYRAHMGRQRRRSPRRRAHRRTASRCFIPGARPVCRNSYPSPPATSPPAR